MVKRLQKITTQMHFWGVFSIQPTSVTAGWSQKKLVLTICAAILDAV